MSTTTKSVFLNFSGDRSLMEGFGLPPVGEAASGDQFVLELVQVSISNGEDRESWDFRLRRIEEEV